MRVLLAAPQDMTVLGVAGSYCERAISSLGHETAVFDFRNSPEPKSRILSGIKSAVRSVLPQSISPYGIPALRTAADKAVNDRLMANVRAFRPDLLLVLLGENITADTLESVRSAGVITANWLFDSIILPHRLFFMRQIAKSYDHIFLIDSPDVLDRFELNAKNIASVPLGCDPDVHRRVDLSADDKARYGCDIAFVGTVTPVREKILKRFKDMGMKIWGRWQKPDPALSACYRDKDIYGAEAVKVYNAAKIVLDIHGQYGVHPELFNVTPRVFEVPASGGFLLTNDIKQLHGLYRVGEEIMAYDDAGALEKLVKYFLSHDKERASVAEAGHIRAYHDHTYKKRLDSLINIVKNK